MDPKETRKTTSENLKIGSCEHCKVYSTSTKHSLQVQKWRLVSPGPRPTKKPMKDNIFRGFNCRIWLTNYDPRALKGAWGTTTSSSFWHPLPLALWKLVLSLVCFCFVFIFFLLLAEWFLRKRVREADDSHFLPSQYHYQTKQPACIVPFRVLNHQLLRPRIKVGKSSSFLLFANNVLLVLGLCLMMCWYLQRSFFVL